MRLALFIVLLACWSIPAAEWIPATRTNVAWMSAGVVGGIPRRTTISALLDTNATAANINDAIAACASNSVVLLTNGTFTLYAPLTIAKSGVSLRGAGITNNVPATRVVFHCTGEQADPAHIKITSTGSGMFWDSSQFYAATYTSVSSGYTQGSTQLVVSSAAGFAVGQIVMMDQEADGTYFPTYDGCNTWTRPTCRQLSQWFRVVAIDGTTISVWPHVAATNWAASASPELCHWSGTLVEMSGIEDIGFDTSSNSTNRPIEFAYAYSCWLSNVWWHDMDHEGIRNYGAMNCEANHCYFTGHQDNESQTYFFLVGSGSGFKIVNSIFVDYHNAIQISGHSGGVFAFNYFTNDTMGNSWNLFPHNGGTSMNLVEGNHAADQANDSLQGESLGTVTFRNRLHGEDGTGFSIRVMTNHNLTVIGNVLGTTNLVWDTHLLVTPSIFNWQGNDWNDNCQLDFETTNSMIRDFNWWTNGVVDDPNYSGTVPNSLAYASKPGWFGDRPWPWVDPSNPSQAVTTNLPAGYRFVYGTDPPPAANAPRNLRVLGTLRAGTLRGS